MLRLLTKTWAKVKKYWWAVALGVCALFYVFRRKPITLDHKPWNKALKDAEDTREQAKEYQQPITPPQEVKLPTPVESATEAKEIIQENNHNEQNPFGPDWFKP